MQYFRPRSIDDFFSIEPESCTILAGGTDLLPCYEKGKPLPSNIVDVKHIPEIDDIKEVGINLEIGAAATIEDIKKDEIIKKGYPALYQSTIDFGSVQIRNRATIGGNICNASPAGDLLPALYAYDAKLLLRNKDGNRLVNIEDFILDPGKTAIKNGEILEKIIIPESCSKSVFCKLGLREAMAISVVNFAIVYEDNKLTIAVGAAAPTIVIFKGLAKLSVKQLLNKIDDGISPIDDIRVTAKYRRKVLRNMLEFELNKII